jgi:hypothetical protein
MCVVLHDHSERRHKQDWGRHGDIAGTVSKETPNRYRIATPETITGARLGYLAGPEELTVDTDPSRGRGRLAPIRP